eukprot:CAMPEP_0117668424 /NCGR_PEP_ID=MMETSP0804-20121206/11544_1 /TAXON_ID=1074897 /ORGANISM="Tetraselmis astigmatica, Strain CCMP880" /LENGTH=169 /DNA_ID=CAMNT_0005476319 /DNA_START=101 /DNA_END=610 /DNA_ORIENTATION=+
MEPSAEELAAHKAFMDSLGQEASEKGYMPPMDMVRSFTEGSTEESAAAKAKLLDFRGQGNNAMQAGEFSRALDYYTQALETIHSSGQPSKILHILFGNRSAALLKLEKAEDAADDARSAVAANPSYVKGYFRLASALAQLDDKSGMRAAAQKGLDLDPANRELQEILKS